MPTYDYYCRQCERSVSIFWRTISEAKEKEAVCPKCGGKDLERRVSPFKHLRSKSQGPSLPVSDSELRALEGEDPKAMARLFRQMSKEMDEPMEPDMEEVVDRLEKGESPEKIEKELDKKEE